MIHRTLRDTNDAAQDDAPIFPKSAVDDEPIDDGFNPHGSGPVPVEQREDEAR